MAIPPLVHQIWVNPGTGGSEGLPWRVRRHARRWARLHPDFQHQMWDLDSAAACGDDLMPGFSAALRSLRFPASQADLARLAILLRHGGFWADLKVVPLRPFLADLVDHDLVLTEHHPTAERPVADGFLNNSFIGASPDNPLVARCLERALHNVDRRWPPSVFEMTGPRVLMNVRDEMLSEPGGLGDVEVLEQSHTWGVLIDNWSSSYNRGGRHWAERQQLESIFLDD